VYHKDANCLELEANKANRYASWKSVFAEYDAMGYTNSSADVMAWIKFYKSNKLTCKTQPLRLHNYFTPLTSQVEALDRPREKICCVTAQTYSDVQGNAGGGNTQSHSSIADLTKPRRKTRKIVFTLPPGHTDKDSKEWRRSPRSRSKPVSFADAQLECARLKLAVREPIQQPRPRKPLTEQQLKKGVLNGSIPSAAWDTACTSNAGKIGDPFIPTNQRSTKVFALADGHPAPGTTIAKLHHPIREPARTVDMVPALAENSLLSGGKFAEAGYISICDGNEVNIYDGHTARIVVSEAAVLKGWRCPQSKLWRVPLQSHVTDLNMHTLLLDGPTGCESLNSLYTVPSSAAMLDHIELFTSNPHRPNPTEAINNVYELPSIEKAVRYLHGAAGFPTKATWLKSIRNGNYLSWPLVNVKNVNKFFS